MKKIIKIVFSIVAILICLQFVTYYLFAKESIVCHIGKHFETYILNLENQFEEVLVAGNVPLDRNKVLASFSDFKKYELRLCENLPEKCIENFDWNEEGKYQYLFEMKNNGAFTIHTINEFEHASAYGARWESYYIWVVFKWVLIRKESRGIS